MFRLLAGAAVLAAILFLPQIGSATLIVSANDILKFTTANAVPGGTGDAGGYFETEELGTASGVFQGVLIGTVAEDMIGADFHLEMELAPPGESPILLFQTPFQSMPGIGADLVICCDVGSNDYLTATIDTIRVTNITELPILETMNLGDLNGTSFELTITGGTLASLFENQGELFIKVINPTVPLDINSTFDESFDSSANIYLRLEPIPEPGTALILGGALVVISLARRKACLSSELIRRH